MDQDSFEIDYEGSLILRDAEIRGDIKSDKGIYLKGTVRGRVDSDSRVIVNNKAVIDGDVECQELFLDGVITGNVCVSARTVIGGHGVIKGVLVTDTLEVVPGSVIEGGLRLKKSNNK